MTPLLEQKHQEFQDFSTTELDGPSRVNRWIPVDHPTPALHPEEAEALTNEWLRIADEIHGLPSDLAERHDHYLHGTP